MTVPRCRLPDDQYFSYVVARQEEFDRGEVAEKILDVAIIENALQAEGAGGLPYFDGLHIQSIGSGDVEAVTRGIGSGFLGMEES